MLRLLHAVMQRAISENYGEIFLKITWFKLKHWYRNMNVCCRIDYIFILAFSFLESGRFKSQGRLLHSLFLEFLEKKRCASKGCKAKNQSNEWKANWGHFTCCKDVPISNFIFGVNWGLPCAYRIFIAYWSLMLLSLHSLHSGMGRDLEEQQW